MSKEVYETDLNYIRGDDHWCFSSTDRSFIAKIKKLREVNPDDIQILVEKPDGSIVAHIPKSYVYIRRKRKRELTDAQKEVLAERIRNARMKMKSE